MSTTNNLQPIHGLYEELNGVLRSIQSEDSWFDDKGFAEQVNGIIRRTLVICPEIEKIDPYIITTDNIGQRGSIIQAIQAKSKIRSYLLEELRGHTISTQNPQSTSGPTFIQNQSQTQTQHQTTILALQERVITEIENYAKGTKERSFLESLKSTLPSLSSTMGIFSAILSIAKDTELDIDVLKNILGL